MASARGAGSRAPESSRAFPCLPLGTCLLYPSPAVRGAFEDRLQRCPAGCVLQLLFHLRPLTEHTRLPCSLDHLWRLPSYVPVSFGPLSQEESVFIKGMDHAFTLAFSTVKRQLPRRCSALRRARYGEQEGKTCARRNVLVFRVSRSTVGLEILNSASLWHPGLYWVIEAQYVFVA